MSKDMLENTATQQPMIGESVFNTVGQSQECDKTQGGYGGKRKIRANSGNICIEFRRFDNENKCWTNDVINATINHNEKSCNYCFNPKKLKQVFGDIPDHVRTIFRFGDWWLQDMKTKKWTLLTDVYEGCVNKYQSVCGCKFQDLIHIPNMYQKFDIPDDYWINHIYKPNEYPAILKLNQSEFPEKIEKTIIEINDTEESFPSLGGNNYSKVQLVDRFDNSVTKLHEGKSISEIEQEVECKENWNSYVKIPVKDDNGLSDVRQEIRRECYLNDRPQPNWCKIVRTKRGRGNRTRGKNAKGKKLN